MGKFADAKKKLTDEISASTQKKTFNETYFNVLSTAMLNDAGYEKEELKNKGGELKKEVTTPIADLRKNIIGSVAKSAGCDAAEQERLINEHQFPVLPMYDYVESSLREYLSLGKNFPFARQDDFQAALGMETVAATVKDVRVPGSNETHKQRQGEYKKLKAKSTCPKNLRVNI